MENQLFDEQSFKSNIVQTNFKRLGKTFKTENGFYFYDVGTGKVLECEKEGFTILEALEKGKTINELKKEVPIELWEKGIEEIKLGVQLEHILQAPELKSFSGGQTNGFENFVNNHLSQITLEMTEKCNLRCKYCIYQEGNEKFRDFNNPSEIAIDMNQEIAKKALDYALSHADPNDFYVTFYGGEPLINFELLRWCVNYVQSKRESKIHYSVTTNLTLMTKERAVFFASVPNFSIICSIDGDQETHDENRITVNGKGTHEDTMKGLKNIVEAYGKEREGEILINMVVSQPYNFEKFDRIQNFLNTCPYISADTVIMYSYVDHGERSNAKKQLENEPEELTVNRWNPLLQWMEGRQENSKEDNIKLFPWYNKSRSYLKIHRRRITDFPLDSYYLNGCCIPGSRRIYVTAKGKYHICERVGEVPDIGNADTGIDFPKLTEKYINEYCETSIKDCSKCWAVNLCNICYAQCYDEQGLNADLKKLKCIQERRQIEYALTDYHSILEKSPESLEYLNDFV